MTTYRIAGIDVHKKMLAVAVADIAVEGEYHVTRRRVGTSPTELRELLSRFRLIGKVAVSAGKARAKVTADTWTGTQRL